MPKVNELKKSGICIKFVIPANPGSNPGQAPESIYFKMFWTPAFARVTLRETFTGSSKLKNETNLTTQDDSPMVLMILAVPETEWLRQGPAAWG